jgi:hypothetical protein
MRSFLVGSALSVEKSANSKLGKVSVTYTGINSCAKDCGLLNIEENGDRSAPLCYAMGGGPVSWQLRKLDNSKTCAEEIAQDEAKAIDSLSGKRDLRLHVAGDCETREAVRIVADACDRYIAKNGRSVWAYTHAWRNHSPSDWGKISILASCDTPEDVFRAKSEGWATATIVPEFPGMPGDKGFGKVYEKDGVKILPCPEMVREEIAEATGEKSNINCASCRLCWKADKLKDAGITIGFAAHGVREKQLKDSLLPVID